MAKQPKGTTKLQACSSTDCKRHHRHVPTTIGDVLIVGDRKRGVYLWAGPVEGNASALVDGVEALRALRDAIDAAIGSGQQASTEQEKK